MSIASIQRSFRSFTSRVGYTISVNAYFSFGDLWFVGAICHDIHGSRITGGKSRQVVYWHDCAIMLSHALATTTRELQRLNSNPAANFVLNATWIADYDVGQGIDWGSSVPLNLKRVSLLNDTSPIVPNRIIGGVLLCFDVPVRLQHWNTFRCDIVPCGSREDGRTISVPDTSVSGLCSIGSIPLDTKPLVDYP